LLLDHLRSGLVPIRCHVAAAEQVLVGLRLPLVLVPVEIGPEGVLNDRQRSYFLALGEDGQPSPFVVEVAEADLPQGAYRLRKGASRRAGPLFEPMTNRVKR
jgi:hypothetical protein